MLYEVITNSDIHGVISEEYSGPEYFHRPMTLVFAKERTEASLREALFAGRTAVWYGDRLAAFEEYAAPLFKSVISAGTPFKDDGKTIWFEVTNSSDIPMILTGGPEGAPSALRITSYNVCYTKLLRDGCNGSADKALRQGSRHLHAGTYRKVWQTVYDI